MTKSIYGKVIKKSSDKTVCVLVQTSSIHPIYRKPIRRRRKFLVHDPDNSCVVGEMISAKSCAPVSKSKSYCVISRVK